VYALLVYNESNWWWLGLCCCRQARNVSDGGGISRRHWARHGRQDSLRWSRLIFVCSQPARSTPRTCSQQQRHLPINQQPTADTRRMVRPWRPTAIRRSMDTVHLTLHLSVAFAKFSKL